MKRWIIIFSFINIIFIAVKIFVVVNSQIIMPHCIGIAQLDHFMAQQALGIYGVSGDDGFSWANISFFAVNIATNIVFGLVSLLLLPILNRNYHPEMAEQIS